MLTRLGFENMDAFNTAITPFLFHDCNHSRPITKTAAQENLLAFLAQYNVKLDSVEYNVLRNKANNLIRRRLPSK